MDDQSSKCWMVTRSRHVLKDRWISVRADDCVTTTGVTVAPYYVVEFPDFVHVLAFDEFDRVILVRQYRHGYGGMSLELPGGICDDGESPIATGSRELQEETGYVGDGFVELAHLSVDPARYANRLHLVGVRGVRRVAASPDASEDIEVVHVSRDDALRSARTGGIVNAQHVGLLLIGLSIDW